MSTLLSRPQPARTVLLGYLLAQGSYDRVLQILARIDPTRMLHLAQQLSVHERTLLAALLVRQPALEVMARTPSDVMTLVFGGLDRPDCRQVMAAAGIRAMALVWPFLTVANQRTLVGSNPAATARARQIPARGGLGDTFRLRRLFRS